MCYTLSYPGTCLWRREQPWGRWTTSAPLLGRMSCRRRASSWWPSARAMVLALRPLLLRIRRTSIDPAGVCVCTCSDRLYCTHCRREKPTVTVNVKPCAHPLCMIATVLSASARRRQLKNTASLTARQGVHARWALTGTRGLRLEQRQGDGDGASRAGEVQGGGAGAQPGALAPVAAQHPRVQRRAALGRRGRGRRSDAGTTGISTEC